MSVSFSMPVAERVVIVATLATPHLLITNDHRFVPFVKSFFFQGQKEGANPVGGIIEATYTTTREVMRILHTFYFLHPMVIVALTVVAQNNSLSSSLHYGLTILYVLSRLIFVGTPRAADKTISAIPSMPLKLVVNVLLPLGCYSIRQLLCNTEVHLASASENTITQDIIYNKHFYNSWHFDSNNSFRIGYGSIFSLPLKRNPNKIHL